MGFVLLLTIQDIIFQEACSKSYIFVPQESSNLKMVFILLTEIVVFYIQIAIIKIGVFRLENPIDIVSQVCWMVLGLLNTVFNKLFKQYICWSWLRNRSGFRVQIETFDSRSSITDKWHSGRRKTESKNKAKSKK